MLANVADLEAKLEESWGASDYAMFGKELEEGELLVEWMREPYRAQVIETLAKWKARGKDVLARLERDRDV
jgi:hypothetical protein